MPALSIRIALDCFYLLIFYSEKFSTDVCRLPYAVNVNLNLSIILVHATGQQEEEDVKSLESLMRDEREKAITCVFCHDLH